MYRIKDNGDMNILGNVFDRGRLWLQQSETCPHNMLHTPDDEICRFRAPLTYKRSSFFMDRII